MGASWGECMRGWEEGDAHVYMHVSMHVPNNLLSKITLIKIIHPLCSCCNTEHLELKNICLYF